MFDLRGAVRERLAPFRLDPHQEADVVEELTQELEERHARAVSEGRSPEEADAVVRTELGSESFSSEIQAALRRRRRGRSPMPDWLRDRAASSAACARTCATRRGSWSRAPSSRWPRWRRSASAWERTPPSSRS